MFNDDLEDIFGTSQITVVVENTNEHKDPTVNSRYFEILNVSDDTSITVAVDKADGEKCSRCWKYSVNTNHVDVKNILANKVEDYGVGFYTKYGDGGVDIAPIADLYKTEVWELGKFLGVDSRIVEAKPTDGLWDDGRNDEDQLGASYADLEYAMEHGTGPAVRVLHDFNTQNKHKMLPIPTFKL